MPTLSSRVDKLRAALEPVQPKHLSATQISPALYSVQPGGHTLTMKELGELAYELMVSSVLVIYDRGSSPQLPEYHGNAPRPPAWIFIPDNGRTPGSDEDTAPETDGQ